MSRRYIAAIFSCKVLSKKKPDFVSMVTKSCETPISLIPVWTMDQPKKYSRNFTVCLMPLNFNYSRAYELVEWVELNRILGADKFTIYNYSSAVNVGHVLEHYSKLGLVEVVQWQLPIHVDTWPPTNAPEIHYFGQIAALHDCLYRNKRESRFIVNIDLDEFIIPRGDIVRTWSDIIQYMSDTAGAFIFRNTFFRKEWNDTEEEFSDKTIAKKYKLVTLLKTKHEKNIFRHHERSKYFARTAAVTSLMVHEVPGLTGSNAPVLVETDIGMLHHYRNWLHYNDDESLKVDDNIVVRKYSQILTHNVRDVWKLLPYTAMDLHTT